MTGEINFILTSAVKNCTCKVIFTFTAVLLKIIVILLINIMLRGVRDDLPLLS